MISLERRFVIGLAGVLLIVFLLLLWGSVAAVRSLSEAYVATRLGHDAEALLAALSVSPQDGHRLRQGRITPIYRQPLSGHYYLMQFADGSRIRSRSLWDEPLDMPRLARGQTVTYQGPGPGGQRLLYRVGAYQKGGQIFSLLVAEDMAAVDADIRRFQMIALGVMAAALLLIVVIQRYVLRSGFRALDRVRREIRQVSAGRLDRLQTPGPLEVQPLTAEFNRLMEQVQRRLQRSRRSLGNLAHALKGPLSIVMRDIDALPLPKGQRNSLSGQLDRINALIQREMKRARLAGDATGRPFDPQQQVPELLQALGQIHREKDLQISALRLPTGGIPVDQEDMLELLGNLLDNACKWASQRVELSIFVETELHIVVGDDGPGVPEARRNALLRRGARLDEQVAGHGLGLAIVGDLVEDYRGHISFGESASLHGLEVRVSLPLDSIA
jgi:signal transduction histidine kinase